MKIAALDTTTRTAEERERELGVFVRFAAGYAVLWLVLTAMAERPTTRALASAFAVSIGVVASVYYLPSAARNLGLVAGEGGQ